MYLIYSTTLKTSLSDKLVCNSLSTLQDRRENIMSWVSLPLNVIYLLKQHVDVGHNSVRDHCEL